MKTLLSLICAALVAMAPPLGAQTTIQSNGAGGGDWDSAATWQGGVVPTVLDSVVVLGADSVRFSSAVPESCRSLTVIGKMNVPAVTDTFVVTDVLTLPAGSRYYHASYSGTLPGSTRLIDNASTVVFGSSTVGGPGNLEFGNVIIKRAAGSNAGGSLIINGDLTVDNAGPTNTFKGTTEEYGYVSHVVHGNVYIKQGQWCAVDVGSDTTVGVWNVDGDVIATNPSPGGARVHPFASADAKGLAIMNIHGDLYLGQGARLSGGTSSTRGYGTGIINLYKDFSLVNGAYTTTNHKGPLSVNFVGTGVQTVTMDTNFNFAQERVYDTVAATSTVVFDIGSHYWRSMDTLLSPGGGGAFVVNGTLWLKDSAQLEGTPEFTVNPGGRLIIGSPDGITQMPDSTHGNVQTTGTRTFSTAASYEYASSFPQESGTGLPATVDDLVINNPNGVTLTSDVAVADSLTIADGFLLLNGNVIDLGGTGTLVEAAGKTVRGSAGSVTATRTLVAPSVSVNIAGLGVSIGSAANPGSTTITRGHAPQKAIGINRWYDISPAVNTGLDAQLVFRYDASELNGNDEGTMGLWKSADAGASWTGVTAVNDGPNHALTASGLDGFSRWSASDADHPLVAQLVNYPVNDKWNMVTLPAVVNDAAKTTLFPTATSNAFLYDDGYFTADTIRAGIGYWLKFAGAQSVPVTGVLFDRDTIDLVAGWNMIGTVTDTVDIATGIEEIPPGIVASQYFRYVLGYVGGEPVLYPSRGYWVKANSAGKIVLAAGPAAHPRTAPRGVPDEYGELTITDAAGSSQALYLGVGTAAAMKSDMPPPPPDGAFDARFSTGRMTETAARGNTAGVFPLLVRGAAYPVTIGWKPGAGMAGSVLTLVSGKGAGGWSGVVPANGAITLASEIPGLSAGLGGEGSLPATWSLGINYPNPFNPSTNFEVALPAASTVEVAVYNVLGGRVATIFSGPMAAGYHTLGWDGTTDGGAQAGSGVYILRMSAGGFSAASRIVLMK